MRVTTDLWVSSMMRRAFSAGGFAAILRRGAAEAGAVFLMHRDRFGRVTLYGPAAQTAYETGRPDERYFTKLVEGEEAAANIRMERELRFDPDIWLVELEVAEMGDLIQIAEP